jgi:hypothetical protein
MADINPEELPSTDLITLTRHATRHCFSSELAC